MAKNLLEKALENGSNEVDNWVKTAFNEILGSIYHSKLKEDEFDKLIEKMASVVSEKLGIKENELDWEKVENWHHKEVYNFTAYDYYLDFEDAKKIISKSKISEDYDWEDISSSAMDISKINEKILKTFEEYIDDYNDMDKEILESLIEKGIYINFREEQK